MLANVCPQKTATDMWSWQSTDVNKELWEKDPLILCPRSSKIWPNLKCACVVYVHVESRKLVGGQNIFFN